ncbi:MAG: ABC transporter ATP-binding protein [Caldilineaceae bacterium]|nr:ABC transporter ATP-binding protein [Caldilineaceae bacterium]
MQPIIEVEQLRKKYGTTVAVDDVSFQVQPGEIFGILGPNGAGKTTTVESVIGLRQPNRGRVRVLGLDPQQERTALAQRMGIQLQQANLADRLKVWEALDLFGSFYAHTVPWQPLLEQWGLAEKRDTAFVNLSGGQKQRLFIALALLNDPEVVFLDELTTGLDPQARRNTWELVQEIRAQGKTVVLVTHFMDEAEALCDRLAIIDRGKVIALDRPASLVRSLEMDSRVIFESDQRVNLAGLRGLPQASDVIQNGQKVTVYGKADGLVSVVVRELESLGISFQNLRTEQPSLEDVFIHLTGRQIRE